MITLQLHLAIINAMLLNESKRPGTFMSVKDITEVVNQQCGGIYDTYTELAVHVQLCEMQKDYFFQIATYENITGYRINAFNTPLWGDLLGIMDKMKFYNPDGGSVHTSIQDSAIAEFVKNDGNDPDMILFNEDIVMELSRNPAGEYLVYGEKLMPCVKWISDAAGIDVGQQINKAELIAYIIQYIADYTK